MGIGIAIGAFALLGVFGLLLVAGAVTIAVFETGWFDRWADRAPVRSFTAVFLLSLALALVLLLVPTLAGAEPTPLRLVGHERIPARISDVLVTLPMLAATIDAARADDKSRAFLRLGCRNAVAMGLTELTKRLIHRTRPDGSDRLSMPSGHTATAMANSDSAWSYGVTLGVAWGRQAAGKHYATDVAVGAGVGGLARWVCR